MKRQDAFERMRANRTTALDRTLRKRTDELVKEWEKQKAEWAEQEARMEDYAIQSRVLMQMAALPLMPPEHYADIRERLDRLANEHGIHADKPRRELKVVGGSKC